MTDTVEGLVMVEYGLFGLLDRTGPYPDGAPFGGDPPDVCDGGENWACFRSAGSYHYAKVRLEAHPAAPEPPVGEWEAVGEATFTALSGEVVLWTMLNGRFLDPVRLGEPGSYRLRAMSTGGAAVADAIAGSSDVVKGVEHWLIQTWPVLTTGE